MSFWTKERVEKAIKLWNEGYSASCVAETLGGGVTRNAVIGKMNRMRITFGANIKTRAPSTRATVARRKKVKAKPSRVATALSTAKQWPRNIPFDPVEPTPIPAPSKIAGARNVPLLDLEDHQCRFPTNDAKRGEPHLFCGMRSIPGMPYCLQHTEQAFDFSRIPAGRGFSMPPAQPANRVKERA